MFTTASRQFQFHKGTIKTGFSNSKSVSICYFNSIKVQLKHAADLDIPKDTIRFQFHKGTIKTRKRRRQLSRIYEFQFHKGTIKTLSGYRKVDFCCISIP